MLNDFRHALRQLSQNRGFAAVAILTLALGIGVNTAIFSLADGMLFRPLPFRDPSRLVMIESLDRKTGQVFTRVNRIDFEQIRQHHSGIEGMALFEQIQAFTWVGSDGAESMSTAEGTPNALDVLGVSAALGRPLRPGDELAVPRVAMLTYQAWQRRFGSDPSVVGRTITFDQGSVQIIGVLPSVPAALVEAVPDDDDRRPDEWRAQDTGDGLENGGAAPRSTDRRGPARHTGQCPQS